jgi:glutaminase
MGLCTWSPRLDEIGNSIRGLEFCERLVAEFNFHNFANLTGASAKRDPRQSRIAAKAATVNGLIWAASKGDLGAIEDQRLRGVSLNSADYDMRTPLHLACAENRLEIVEYFVDQKSHLDKTIELSPKDRWGRTPLDDAISYENREIAALLRDAGATQGQHTNGSHTFAETDATAVKKDSVLTEELIWAAAEGDLQAVKRMVARGVSLNSVDYDLRAPLHLAAAEGQLDIVDYLLMQGADKQVRDRWGHTPLDEARRHNQTDVVARLAGRTIKARNEDPDGNYKLAS